MAKPTGKFSDAAVTVKPYVERALRDQELRDNVRSAFESARAVYNELLGGRGMTGVATRVATDEHIQEELRSAIADLRKAADRIQGKEEHTGRNGTLMLIGVTLAILFNPFTGPQTRKFIADKIFGGSEDFTYEGSGNGSTTSAPVTSTES